MQATLPVRHVSVSIERSPEDVYRFVSNVENLSQWASGLGKPIRNSGSDWILDSPMGEIRMRFAERNPFGVLDHDVTLPSGDTFHNPFRVIPNGSGSEVIFSLIRRPGTPDQEYEDDSRTIERDLGELKEVLERG